MRRSRSFEESVPRKGHVLITGGCGFVGINLAHRLLSEGHRVVLYDNLSRDGVEQNLAWIEKTHGDRVDIEEADIRDAAHLRRAAKDAYQVFHFAAQVAVTTSLADPVEDFDINARGTLNVLEALRAQPTPSPLVFTSTNKVYGSLEDVQMQPRGNRYEPASKPVRDHGVSEQRPLDFHSPYGCSKGTADQYVIDYARSYGMRNVVFRMSCIYGAHQFGTEDQGWVAHFLIRALEGKPITLYGDGKQVRDILFVEDLVDAFLLAQKNIETVAGRAYNIGGGPANTTSLLELLARIEMLTGKKTDVTFDDWRTGDQLYYVSDTRRFASDTGWAPAVGVADGVRKLHDWLREHRRSEGRGVVVPYERPAKIAAAPAAAEEQRV